MLECIKKYEIIDVIIWINDYLGVRLSESQAKIFLHIAKCNVDERILNLASIVGISNSAMMRGARVLEREGLAIRVPNPCDARSVILRCTENGIADYRRMIAELECYKQ
jgi:DNA-binding MarR family transcriptional regulator